MNKKIKTAAWYHHHANVRLNFEDYFLKYHLRFLGSTLAAVASVAIDNSSGGRAASHVAFRLLNLKINNRLDAINRGGNADASCPGKQRSFPSSALLPQ